MDSKLLVNKSTYETMAKAVNPYGDERDYKRIVQAILHKFELGEGSEKLDV